MHYLYSITNQFNNKIYIGQSIKPEYRWYQHKSHSAEGSDHKQYIHRAMAKYGIQNFIFEVIATCKTQEDANETESLLIKQDNSRNKEYGYNLMTGGSYGGHSEETKEKMRQATIKQIETQGHPAAGRIVTEETRELQRKIRLENPIEYTEDIRKKMSEAHVAHLDSEETKKKKSEKAKAAWDKKINILQESGEYRCHAHGCTIEGPQKQKYYMVNGLRYCSKHGQRLKRKGSLDSLRDN